MFKLIIGLAVLLPAVYSATIESKHCKQADLLEQYDADIAKLMAMGPDGRPWPENLKKNTEFCIETRRLNERIDNYKNKCLKGTAKEFHSVLIYSIRRAIKQYCRKNLNKRLDSLIKSHICTNKVANKTNVCYTRFVDQLQGIINAPSKLQIPHVCCKYYQMLNCFEQAFLSVAKCRQESETFTDFVRSIFSDLVNLSCADYTENSDKCDRLAEPPSKKKGILRTKSALIPLTEIWENVEPENV